MSEPGAGALIAALEASRAQFLELVAGVRPDLHRYCARMTGSVLDGEDVLRTHWSKPCVRGPRA